MYASMAVSRRAVSVAPPGGTGASPYCACAGWPRSINSGAVNKEAAVTCRLVILVIVSSVDPGVGPHVRVGAGRSVKPPCATAPAMEPLTTTSYAFLAAGSKTAAPAGLAPVLRPLSSSLRARGWLLV